MSDEYTSRTYGIEMLKSSKWMPWKRQMLAVLRHFGLDRYIAKDTSVPGQPAAEEIEAQRTRKWREGELEGASTRALAIAGGDVEMIPHRLRDVLYVPDGTICLLSRARFDEGRGR
jgi:hypothetical protein